jgi:2-haloacid dehalogenase
MDEAESPEQGDETMSDLQRDEGETSAARRDFISAGAASVALGTVGTLSAGVTPAHGVEKQPGAGLEDVKALTFDVFGTVVDWRGSIIREGQLLGQRKGIQRDWPKFADGWRAGYQPAMKRVRSGEIAWTNIDGLHRLILNDLMVQFDIQGLSEGEIDHLNRAWHRLSPWPDAVGGLNRLKTRYVLATLSNGNVSLLVNMAKNAGLPWDCVLSAENFGHYKPDAEVYLGAAKLLGLEPGQVMMTAAHMGDLLAAKKLGLRTALVTRPLEYGPDKKADTAADGEGVVDVVAADFIDLAEKLRA